MFRPARTALWTVHDVYECHFKVSNLKAYTWQIDGESATQIKVLSCPHIALFQVAGWFRNNIFLTVQGWGTDLSWPSSIANPIILHYIQNWNSHETVLILPLRIIICFT